MSSDFKPLFDVGVNATLLAFVVYLVKDYYKTHIKGAIHSAKVAANAAQASSEQAKERVIVMHENMNKAFQGVNQHYQVILEAQALAKNADENTKRLAKLAQQLAQKNLHFESEIQKLGDSLLLIKEKKQ